MRSTRKMRLVCFGAMGVSLTLLSTLFPGTADAANKPGLNSGKPNSLDDRFWKLQAPLVAAANRIHDAADEGQAQGYAGITLDVEQQRVNVFWKGEPPSKVSKQLAVERTQVNVRLESAPYSRAELDKDVHDIVADETARRVPKEKRAQGMSVSPEGLGITAEVEVQDSLEQQKRSKHHVTATQINGPLIPTSRQNDSPPWWGGAVVESGNACSTGFGLVQGSSAWMSAAAHCFTRSTATVYNGQGYLMGSVGNRIPSIDTELLNLSDPRVGGYVYDGAWNDAGYRKPVIGRAANFPGQAVCIDGAFTGARCNAVIENDNYSGTVNGVTIYNAIVARSTDGSQIVGGQDSGGPVFTVSSADGYRNVTARGTIVGIPNGSTVNCTIGISVPYCGNKAIYMPISIIVNTFGVTLKTAPAE